MQKHLLILVLAALMVSSCTLSKAGPLPALTPGASSTESPVVDNPAATPGSLPTLPAMTAPAQVVSPTPFSPFEGKTAVDGLKLRAGPGYLFDTLVLLGQDESLTVLGQAPGGEWLQVKTADDTQGWVFAEYVTGPVDVHQAPVLQPEGTILVKGKITDLTGAPISGVQFALTQGSLDDPNRADAKTDSNGEFFVFFPADSSGEWNVSFVAVDCSSPVWSDKSCTYYKTGYTGVVEPASATITLPQNNALSFLWK